MGMPDRAYLIRGLNDSSTSAYYKLMVKSATLLGADEKIAEKELLKALHFEIALANVSIEEDKINKNKNCLVKSASFFLVANISDFTATGRKKKHQ